MKLGWYAFWALVLASAPALAQGEPPTGALPPVDPAAPPPAEPAPTEQPAPAPAPAPAPPASAAPAPPPGYAPYPPPGYAPYPPPPAPAPPPEPERPKSVSITFSPIHLFLPVFEAMVEVRPVDGFGIAVIGGYGKISADDGLGESHRFDAYEIGGQLSWYPLEPFRSLTLGAELLYVKVETEESDADVDVTGVGDGFAIGPFIGYKLVTTGGFTFLAQGGVQYLAIQAEASNDAGQSASDEESRLIALIN